MMKSQLKAAIAAGRAVLGHLVTIPCVAVVQALAGSGIDFVMIDMEHAPLGIETAAAMIAATNGTVAPIVRVPGAGSVSARSPAWRSAASRSRPTRRRQ